MVGIGRDVRPDVLLENLLAVGLGPAVEHAAAILELAVGGRLHRAVAAARELLAPLPGLGVVEKQRQALKVAARAGGFDLLQVGLAVPQRLVDHRAGECRPLAGPRGRDIPTPDLGLPRAEVEIEGVLLVLAPGRGRDRWRLPSDRRREHEQARREDRFCMHGAHLLGWNTCRRGASPRDPTRLSARS